MFNNFEKNIDRKLTNIINDSLDLLKTEIDKKTPEDTKTLL
jgi:hypothetical protein